MKRRIRNAIIFGLGVFTGALALYVIMLGRLWFEIMEFIDKVFM